nr:hypothetical_protein [Ipomoea batatas]
MSTVTGGVYKARNEFPAVMADGDLLAIGFMQASLPSLQSEPEERGIKGHDELDVILTFLRLITGSLFRVPNSKIGWQPNHEVALVARDVATPTARADDSHAPPCPRSRRHPSLSRGSAGMSSPGKFFDFASDIKPQLHRLSRPASIPFEFSFVRTYSPGGILVVSRQQSAFRRWCSFDSLLIFTAPQEIPTAPTVLQLGSTPPVLSRVSPGEFGRGLNKATYKTLYAKSIPDNLAFLCMYRGLLAQS